MVSEGWLGVAVAPAMPVTRAFAGSKLLLTASLRTLPASGNTVLTLIFGDG